MRRGAKSTKAKPEAKPCIALKAPQSKGPKVGEGSTSTFTVPVRHGE